MSASETPAGAAPPPDGTAAAAAADPAALGFHMPAEWEPHERTWMGWPQRPDNWRDNASHAQKAFVDVASAISQFEPVTVCANEEQAREGFCLWFPASWMPRCCIARSRNTLLHECCDSSGPSLQWSCSTLLPILSLVACLQVAAAREALPPHISVVCIPQDDAWFRDTGPTVRSPVLLLSLGSSGLQAALCSAKRIWLVMPCTAACRCWRCCLSAGEAPAAVAAAALCNARLSLLPPSITRHAVHSQGRTRRRADGCRGGLAVQRLGRPGGRAVCQLGAGRCGGRHHPAGEALRIPFMLAGTCSAVFLPGWVHSVHQLAVPVSAGAWRSQPCNQLPVGCSCLVKHCTALALRLTSLPHVRRCRWRELSASPAPL